LTGPDWLTDDGDSALVRVLLGNAAGVAPWRVEP
jgi:hypothetical protein